MTAFAHLTNRPCPFALLDPSKLAHGHWRAIAPRTAAIALASPSAEARARQASGAAWSDPARATTRRTGTTVSREVGIGDLETRVAETGQADDRVGPSARGPEEHRQPRVQLVERPPRVARSDLLPDIEAADANPSPAEGEDGAAHPRAGFRGEVHDERPERRRIEGRRLLFLGSEKGRAHAGPGERSDGVAGDAVRSALGGDDAGETHHATLRRRVGRSAGVHVIETRAGGRVENAPAAASARAYARPSPRPAPVTIATRPASGCMRPATPGAPSPSTAWTRRNSPGRFRARTAPAVRPRRVFLLYDASRPGGHLRRTSMARFRSTKRAKELQRKAKHEAKEVRKRERREKSTEGVDDDIDWSQAVGIDPPPGTVPSAEEAAESDEEESDEEPEEEPKGSTG